MEEADSLWRPLKGKRERKRKKKERFNFIFNICYILSFPNNDTLSCCTSQKGMFYLIPGQTCDWISRLLKSLC